MAEKLQRFFFFLIQFLTILTNLCLASFSGIKHEWQVNGLEDLKDRNTLAEKLGGSSVISLEGSPI